MQRRDALRLLGALAALPWLPANAEAALDLGRRVHRRSLRARAGSLSPEQTELVAMITEMVIPETDTPGAGAVGVTPFIDYLLTEWYPPSERQQFLRGLDDLDRRAQDTYGAAFTTLPEPSRTEYLTMLDGAKGDSGTAEKTFADVKSLTIYGYFTSERVQKEVLKTIVIPGHYEGCA
ncbi:MAG TPA: gluconate 2-dehydrogenase subunit 3 family protein [Gemmatimonadales bacterium]|nr:gluconate 2-dehydrogenase subunit 3 family protein [Gemmatimonadales bacterium]